MIKNSTARIKHIKGSLSIDLNMLATEHPTDSEEDKAERAKLETQCESEVAKFQSKIDDAQKRIDQMKVQVPLGVIISSISLG